MLTRIYSPSKREEGFTLIELLVVIIIIGVLAAIAIPLFLDQRKLAVDASVKSDVRNTATQVQTWQATNPGIVASDTTAYTAAGGKVVATGTNTVGVAVATDGSYLVCGYVNNAKIYTGANAAYVFDSSTGKFGAGTCTGGLVGGGSPSTSTTPSATATPTPTATPVLAAPTNLTLGTFVGKSAAISWNAVPNATSYTLTYSGGYTGTSTVSGTSTTQTLPIGADPSTVSVAVVAKGAGSTDSPAANLSIAVPGSDLSLTNTNFTFGKCSPNQNLANCSLTSVDGNYSVIAQQDGNFVEYKNNQAAGTRTACFATSTSGSGVVTTLQYDGNLVTYNNGSALRATNTSGSYTSTRLAMQTDGNMVVYANGAAKYGSLYSATDGSTYMYKVGTC
jgi:type IV pilus assembly protein PilA